MFRQKETNKTQSTDANLKGILHLLFSRNSTMNEVINSGDTCILDLVGVLVYHLHRLLSKFTVIFILTPKTGKKVNHHYRRFVVDDCLLRTEAEGGEATVSRRLLIQ